MSATPFVILAIIVVALVAVAVVARRAARSRLADAREQAQRWYERLGGQTLNLVADPDDTAARQALLDAGERYNAAGSQLERATTARQYELAGETAVEGLYYVQAAREAMGLDPGPAIPDLAGRRGAGAVTERMDVDVDGRHYAASPRPGADTSHYYPGGVVSGRRVPAGWYSEPWWKTALVAGAWGFGSMMIFNALITPGLTSGAIEGAYDAGYADGLDGGDPGADGGGDGGDAGGDFGDFGSGDIGGGGDFGF